MNFVVISRIPICPQWCLVIIKTGVNQWGGGHKSAIGGAGGGGQNPTWGCRTGPIVARLFEPCCKQYLCVASPKQHQKVENGEETTPKRSTFAAGYLKT